MTKYFIVEVPVVMKVTMSVPADTATEAIEKIWDNCFRVSVSEPPEDAQGIELYDWEWEMHEKIVRGSMYSGCINEVDAYPDSSRNEGDE